MDAHDFETMFPPNPTSEDIFCARLFEEPLVPIGAIPSPAENAALAGALTAYANRSGPDDFAGLTGFLEAYPTCPWNVALLTNLGLEYFNTGHYSKTLEVWQQAWDQGREAADPKGRAIADRAVGELAYMYARLGRMAELDALLKSVEGRAFSGPATERITGAREGLWTMENRPDVAFRCGPFALQGIKLSIDPADAGNELIHACASQQGGYSLVQLGELSEQLGLDFRMAVRTRDAAFVVPSVVHLKVEHFAAITRQDGDRYLLQDPTFRNDLWITRDALEAETSGYFLIPNRDLARGWRAVDPQEGETVWGKGTTGDNEPGPHAPGDPASPLGGGNSCPRGMAASRVHLMLVSLNIIDEPLGYAPPVGPAVPFIVRYNQRDAGQTGNVAHSNLGHKWTFDWLSYIQSTLGSGDVTQYVMGGGTRQFSNFNPTTKSYPIQQFDQTTLSHPSADTYEMVSTDGTMKIFGKSDGAAGTTRKTFLTKLIDPSGNAVSLDYDEKLRLTTITDAIGQITTLVYAHETDCFKITKVIDPFGRCASFAYDDAGRLITITDVLGLISAFTYDVDGVKGSTSDFIVKLTTVYGETTFTKTEEPGNVQRSLETRYPDGERDRVEFNQSDKLGIPDIDPVDSVPVGVGVVNRLLSARNTYYWDKLACASAYRQYNKAHIYHWLHSRVRPNFTSGILESAKAPLENRVWYDYSGQSAGPTADGASNQPAHIGRVLDDGSTQLYAYEYNGAGNITRQIDPLGRTLSYLYAKNGIDLQETRQTRAGQNELLSKTTYTEQHQPVTSVDAAGQTTRYTYEPSAGKPHARGQVLTETNAKDETTTYNYDDNGRLTSIAGPLPGSFIGFTYDSVGRKRTQTDDSGYTLSFDYDNFDRVETIAFPDATTDQFTYSQLTLDLTRITDRAGRETTFEYNSIRQMTRRTDPLDRATLFQWCKCGALKSLTDAMGRTTAWQHDLQGRLKCKEYADGSKVTYRYERTMSRVSQRIDEKLQVTQYDYNRDNTLRRIAYNNAAVATPPIAFAFDANYSRVISMTDGTGTTDYTYFPIHAAPSLGAGQLASVDGPLLHDAITFIYDELGRRVSTAVDGVAATVAHDAAGRIVSRTNALGAFTHTYEGNSGRIASETYPHEQTTELQYAGNLQDQHLRRIAHKVGITPISEFIYGREVPTGQITSWSQQAAASTPLVYDFAYDPVDQLTAASVSEAGNVVKTFNYSYDAAGNRLTEQVDATLRQFFYNALNELTSIEGDIGPDVAYEWDAEHRLISVTSGNQNTQFTYDGLGRRVRIRCVVNGAEVSDRQFVWCGHEICQERTPAGVVSKRYFAHGVKVESGADAGAYFYSRDHLGSIREVTDIGGAVRAAYSYDPFGRRLRISGDVEADFGFAGMFWSSEVDLYLTLFRAYDPLIGRWLSRDPLENAESAEGPNLYAYVLNNPVRVSDPLGLCCEEEQRRLSEAEAAVEDCLNAAIEAGSKTGAALSSCRDFVRRVIAAHDALQKCQKKPCKPPKPAPAPPPCPPAPSPNPLPPPRPPPPDFDR